MGDALTPLRSVASLIGFARELVECFSLHGIVLKKEIDPRTSLSALNDEDSAEKVASRGPIKLVLRVDSVLIMVGVSHDLYLQSTTIFALFLLAFAGGCTYTSEIMALRLVTYRMDGVIDDALKKYSSFLGRSKIDLLEMYLAENLREVLPPGFKPRHRNDEDE